MLMKYYIEKIGFNIKFIYIKLNWLNDRLFYLQKVQNLTLFGLSITVSDKQFF